MLDIFLTVHLKNGLDSYRAIPLGLYNMHRKNHETAECPVLAAPVIAEIS
jgi:hypothetical protein